MKLSIIIVNYNVKYFLEQCLSSVQAAIKNIDAETWVIDNASSDGSVDYLEKKFRWVKFIINKDNEGFARANNIALKKCTGDFVLFLNPDTIIPEDILQHCLAFFNSNKNAGAIGVRMLDGSGNYLPESKRSFPSPLFSFFKLAGLAALFPTSSFFNRYALGQLNEYKVHEVDVLCGAFIMAKRVLLLELNGFDEAFFMYGEDIDLCYRISKTGHTIYYLGNETIIHFKGESAGKKSIRHINMFYKAMHVFVKKHYAGSKAGFMKLFLQCGIYFSRLISFITAPFKLIWRKNYIMMKNNPSILLIGGETSVSEAKKIIQVSKPHAVMNTAAVLTQYNFRKADEIVFCTGELSWKQAIQWLSIIKNDVPAKWHGMHMDSVTGSIHKKITGEVYSLENG